MGLFSFGQSRAKGLTSCCQERIATERSINEISHLTPPPNSRRPDKYCARLDDQIGGLDVPEEPSVLGVPGSGDGDLWQAVAALPDKQRQAVAYHYVAGLAYAEIAGILGGTTDAARRAAADGVKNLRKSYPGATTEGAPA